MIHVRKEVYLMNERGVMLRRDIFKKIEVYYKADKNLTYKSTNNFIKQNCIHFVTIEINR